MPPARAARLIDHMTPGQAADVLAVLPWADVRAILHLLDQEKREKVQDILENQEGRVGGYVSTDFIKLSPATTVLQARQILQAARARDAVAYLYVLDPQDKLLGIIHTTDLLTSSDETPLQQIMKSAALTLSTETTLKEAAELFARYHYRAFPAVDPLGKMQGIVLYRDVMNLKH